MINKKTFAQEKLSNLLIGINDCALQNTLRKILFSSDQDWDNIYDLMVKQFPEIKNEVEQIEAAITFGKLTEEKIPHVKMGATISFGSDSYPYEVIEVLTLKKIKIRSMDYKRIDKNGLSENQKYEYISNPNGVEYIATLRKDGKWKIQNSSTTVSLGRAIRYIDPSF